MPTNKEFFGELYLIASPEYLTSKQYDQLLMSGRINWDKYFIPFETNRQYEVIENVELLEFDFAKDMFEYIKTLNKISFINFSLEHEKPCVLKFA